MSETKRLSFLELVKPVSLREFADLAVKHGLSRDQTVEALRHRFAPTSIAEAWKCAWERLPRKSLPTVHQLQPPKPTRAKVGKQKLTQREKRLRVANILHLVDLKRAGHSPQNTEFQIGREQDRTYSPAVETTASLFGSSAAMAAELGS